MFSLYSGEKNDHGRNNGQIRKLSVHIITFLPSSGKCTKQPHRPGRACRSINALLTPSYIQGTHVPTWHKAWHTGYAHYCHAKLLVAKETCGRGRVPCCCHSSQFAPCQLSPSGRNKREVGGEVGRSRGQQFNRAMWSSGTSLAIIVCCANHSSSQMPAHMQHFSR